MNNDEILNYENKLRVTLLSNSLHKELLELSHEIEKGITSLFLAIEAKQGSREETEYIHEERLCDVYDSIEQSCNRMLEKIQNFEFKYPA